MSLISFWLFPLFCENCFWYWFVQEYWTALNSTEQRGATELRKIGWEPDYMIAYHNCAMEALVCVRRSWWGSKGSKRWWCSSRCRARTQLSLSRSQHPGLGWQTLVMMMTIITILMVAMMVTCSIGTSCPTMVRPPVPRYWPAATSWWSLWWSSWRS